MLQTTITFPVNVNQLPGKGKYGAYDKPVGALLHS